MHKTGTSTVQDWLRRNAARLEGAGIRVAPDAAIFVPKRPDRLDRTALAALLAGAGDGQAETLIVSHESLSVTPAPVLAALGESLAGHPLRLVLAIRHWQSYLPARWIQNCLRRDAQPFDAFLARLEAAPDRPDFRFDRALDALGALGADETRLISYDAARREGTVPEATLDALGVPAALYRGETFPTLNRSLAAGDADRLRLFNGVLAGLLGLPRDALFDSLAAGAPVGAFFDLFHDVERLRRDRPGLAGRLDALIGDTAVTTSLDRPSVAGCEARLLARPGTLFANATHADAFDPAPAGFRHSSLTAEDLAPALRREMADALRALGR